MLAACALAMSLGFAQGQKTEDAYVFTTVKKVPITSVKNQNRSGTCWCYSTLGFFESELLRMGKGPYDLSEMFVVSHSYKDKADKFVRIHGMMNFGEGGSSDDVNYVIKHYGIVPEEAQPGENYGDSLPVHGEMEAAAAAYLKAIVSNPNGKLSTAWKRGYDGIIDAYLGPNPKTFTYKGKEYTPLSFAKELGLNMDNYVSLTSYTHHPFYTQFALALPDNWRWAKYWNVPIDDLVEIVNNAINKGYTIAWGADVSETGFTRDGLGVVPDVKAIMTSGSDQARWVGLSTRDKNAEIRKDIEKPCKELKITQAMRQEAYDNYQTTDDHGMQIFGIAKDQTGKTFYMVKNSWGTNSKYKGIWYVSEAFLRYKTMDIMVNKAAIPEALRSKLGI
jgi:aminopeptidase C